MIAIKRKINLRIEKRKKKGVLVKENAPIFFRLTYNGNRINLYSGYRVDLKEWNEETEKVNPKLKYSNEEFGEDVNMKLAEYKSILHTFFINCQIKEIIPSKEEIKAVFQNSKNDGKEKFDLNEKNSVEKKDFFDFFDDFIKDQGKLNNWTTGTEKKFKALKSHLLDYDSKLSFEKLDKEGMSDLLSYFFNQKLSNVTTKKYIKNLKWFLRYAVRNGFTTITEFEHFNPKIKDANKKIIFLSEAEIKLIKQLIIPERKQYLHRVRDILLFTCYTGLRYSDVQKLKKSDIKNNKIELLTKKTNDFLTIELNDTSKEILEKYKEFEIPNNLALPTISNQKTNKYLKELGQLADIDEPITHYYYIGNIRHEHSMPKYEYFSSHLGRRTFICLCISRNIPIQVIMKWTGHSDYQSMKPYIDVVDATKEVEMQKLN